ncbi:hypothetical protein D5H78_10235 [Vallicoccus soli]|uniref:Exo-alpha-sialidase n=1 Tax=Vallicoccus soli TaxID=2339232 RepID=A0A3A3YX25_9ACTN|nr:hypothetical protein D5H78_10235 [Vallicoccus soli]
MLRALLSEGEVVAAPPGPGPGYWAGGPSAVLHEGTWWLAYRLRRPVDRGRGYANVVARSDDGVRFIEVARVTSEDLGAASLERPALVVRPDGGWRLYVSCSTAGSKHWWVEALDAGSPAALASGRRTVVLPGGRDEAWKDVVVRVDDGAWAMWACRHPLDGGDDEADRMSSWYATSADGLRWDLRGEALGPGEGWDRRGARVSAVWPAGGGAYEALYDGRASAAENWYERTGAAAGPPGRLRPTAGPVPEEPGPALRYASVVPVPGGLRVYVERTRADGAHDLRTVYVPRPDGESQSV